MKQKNRIRKPKQLIEKFLVIYAIMSVFFILTNISEQAKLVPSKITGSATGTVRIFLENVTTAECTAPKTPLLNPVSDTKTTSVTMSWTTYGGNDQFVFDSESSVSADSPQTKSRLSRGEHTWKVRSCSSDCCSAYATDTFRILPSNPSPTGIAVGTAPKVEEEVLEITKSPEVRTPSPAKISFKDIVQNLLKMAYLILTLTISIVLFGILLKRRIFIGKKEVRLKKLIEYIIEALRKDFSETQIRTKLKNSNAAEEETDRAFIAVRKLKEFRTK